MKILKSHKGSAILTVIFLLLAILTVSVIGLDIILSGLAARRAQGSSARAYQAAEAGIERAIMAFKLDKVASGQPLFTGCSPFPEGGYLKFCGSANCAVIDDAVACETDQQLYNLQADAAQPSYWVHAKITGRDVELNSRGSYLTTSRELYVKFCLPDCFGKTTGATDGCGGTCK
jgi:hypothetical protein